jgi:hypothetical protein
MATVQGCDCAILLFRPPPEGHTNHHIAVDLDRVSGGDGYAHAAVECCREDWTPVAIEADVSGKMVHYSELTKWTEPAKGASPRAYGRLAIRHLHRFGVMCPSFCRQVKDLLGLPYSAWRAYPVLPDSAKALLASMPKEGLLCTDVITQSLPADLVKRMFVFLQNTHRDQPGVACLGTDDKILLSPNGIAFALGLAPASDVTGPAHELRPNLLC